MTCLRHYDDATSLASIIYYWENVVVVVVLVVESKGLYWQTDTAVKPVSGAFMFQVVGARKNGRARGRHACLPLVRQFFLAPTTSKRLLRGLQLYNCRCSDREDLKEIWAEKKRRGKRWLCSVRAALNYLNAWNKPVERWARMDKVTK